MPTRRAASASLQLLRSLHLLRSRQCSPPEWRSRQPTSSAYALQYTSGSGYISEDAPGVPDRRRPYSGMQLRHIILGIRRDRGDDDVRDARCSAVRIPWAQCLSNQLILYQGELRTGFYKNITCNCLANQTRAPRWTW